MIWLVTMAMGAIVGAILVGEEADLALATLLFLAPMGVGLLFDLPIIPIATFILIVLYLAARPF